MTGLTLETPFSLPIQPEVTLHKGKLGVNRGGYILSEISSLVGWGLGTVEDVLWKLRDNTLKGRGKGPDVPVHLRSLGNAT